MISSLLGRNFWIVAYAMLAAGLWLPGNYHWLQPAVPIVLGGILFFSSLKISIASVAEVARSGAVWGRVAVMSVAILVLLPLIAYGAVRWCLPMWAMGILLVGAMPVGLSCVAFTDLYRGTVPLALILALVTSVLAPVTVPLLIGWCDANGAGFDRAVLLRRALYIAVVLVVPFVLAQLVRRMAPVLVERHRPHWGPAAVLCSCLLVFASVASSRDAWKDYPASALLAPLAAACLADAIFLTLGVLGGLLLDRGAAIAFALSCVYVNNGLAIAFVTQFFPGNARMTLPAIMMQVPMVAGVALYGALMNRRATSPA